MIIKIAALQLCLILAFCVNAQNPEIVQSLQTASGENTPLIADVSGDGIMDLLVASENNGKLDVWLGKGELVFVHQQTYAVGDNPTSLAVADFNQDGHNDLIVANHERQYLTILFGESNGQFGSTQQIELSVLPHPHVVEAVDMNSDGHMDVVLDSRDQSGLVVLYGNGQGDFNRATTISVKGAPYLGFALGDTNGDGRVDVVTPNANSISILTGAADASFTFKQTIVMPQVFAVGLADFDGDHNLDLIAASNNGAIHLYLGHGNGQFKAEAVSELQVNEGAKLITTGDFDGNGSNDAVISNWNGGIHLIDFSGQKLNKKSIDKGEIIAPWGSAAGDLNGNGKDEIVLTDGAGMVLNIYSTENRNINPVSMNGIE